MLNKLLVQISDLKMVGDREFTCYGSIKNVVDNVGDMVMDGAFVTTIANHMKNETMPLMFFNHGHLDPQGTNSLPCGTWLEMKEDSKGLWLKGRLSDTTLGNDLITLIKDKAIGAYGLFSIGYNVIRSRKNVAGYTELLELDVKEVSIVTYAANTDTHLLEIKSKVSKGEMVTKSDLRDLLLEQTDLSRRTVEKITRDYNPTDESKMLISELEQYPMFQ